MIGLSIMGKPLFRMILAAVVFGGAGRIQNAKMFYRPPEITD